MAKSGCDKNCSTCDLSNRAYCAVQLGLKNQELILEQENLIKSLLQVLSPLLTQAIPPISPIPGGEQEEKAPEIKNK